jgi:integration host factor subunit beta
MIKSELVALLATRYEFPNRRDAERVVDTVLDTIVASLVLGRRVELRGFGSSSVKQRPARMGRNPRSDTPVWIDEKRQPCFRGSKEMRGRLNGPAR